MSDQPMLPPAEELQREPEVPADLKSIWIGIGAMLLSALTVSGCVYGFGTHFGWWSSI